MVSFTSTVLAAAALLSTSALAYSGDGTYYDPNGGTGSCGQALQNSESIVALPLSFGKTYCGKTISITYNGKTVNGVRVADSCGGCQGDSIDMTEPVFKQLAPLSVGRLHGVQWHFA